jgi:uncharacterized SAM-binding protein YcdF (DUF218 family)
MNQALEPTGRARKYRKSLPWGSAVLFCCLATAGCLMLWGGRLLEASDPLPPHADAAIVLEGSLAGERVRLEGAIQLLRQGVPGRVLVTLPPTSYWGDPVAPMARHFLETNYGHDLAERVDFCDVGADVDSTLQEAHAIGKCIQEQRWGSVVVVTSNYHSRRAGIIWRRVMRKENPALQVSVYGVADKDFQADGWWRKRLWAKTWLLESSKLIWAETFGR